jgi:hypothetical protein
MQLSKSGRNRREAELNPIQSPALADSVDAGDHALAAIILGAT